MRACHVRAAKFVDRLLAVADHGQLPVSSEPLEQLQLRAAGVLELVDQKHADPLLFGISRREVVGEKVAAEPRQVVEIERAGLQLAVARHRVARDQREVGRERRAARPSVGVEHGLERLLRGRD